MLSPSANWPVGAPAHRWSGAYSSVGGRVRILKSLVAVGTVAATATALAMAPAVADPVNSKGHAVKPKLFDIVGVGSNTTQFLLDQFSVNYNKAHSKVHNAR